MVLIRNGTYIRKKHREQKIRIEIRSIRANTYKEDT